MDSLHFKIYCTDFRHATWTAIISTLTLQISDILRGQPKMQNFLSILLPCYMDSLHFKVYSADSRHATWRAKHFFCRLPPCYMDIPHFNIYSAFSRHGPWTAYISTFTHQNHAMLHEQPKFQHLLATLLQAT